MSTLKYKVGQPFPTFPYKDPDATLDYAFDWGDIDDPWLAVEEEILTSTWAITGTDAALLVGTDTIQTGKTVVFLSGGTVGVRYQVTNTITTSDGRTTQRSAYIQIREL